MMFFKKKLYIFMLF